MEDAGVRPISCLQFNWHQLKPNTLLLVNREFLVDLFQKCIEKAGNLNRFCHASGLTYPSIYHFLNGRIHFISIHKLRVILDYLGFPYSVADSKILEVRKGKLASVVSPHFPIDLNCPDMGTLLGHIVSDGSIYVDLQRNHLRTKYTNSDSELIDRFLDATRRVFGNVHHTSEPTRGSFTIRFGSEMVGVALAAAGAMVGNKTKQNGDLPWLVREGKEAIKIAYLRAAFSDEGSVGASNGFPYLILTRYYTIPPTVDRVFLSQFDCLMRSSVFPTGHIRMCMSLRRVITCANASDGFPSELFSLLIAVQENKTTKSSWTAIY